MQYLNILSSLIPLIIGLMRIAEDLNEPKSGTYKKEFVLAGAKEALTEIAKGSEDETWGKTSEALSGLIDLFARLLF